VSVLDQNPRLIAKVNVPAGLAGAAVGFTTGWIDVTSVLSGSLRGNAHQDVAGVSLIEFSNDASNVDLSFTVTQDVTQPGFQYPFSVIILQPFARVSFTNGGAASTFFRANVEVQPF